MQIAGSYYLIWDMLSYGRPDAPLASQGAA
jgi:hypothetical protein